VEVGLRFTPMTSLLLPLVLMAAVERPFAEERVLLDRRLETLRRILPDGPRPSSDIVLLKELAEGAKLRAVDALARPPVESGSRGDVLIDLTSVGRFADIDRFFRQVALSHRLIDVESLTLTGTPDDSVRLTAVLRCPYRPLKAPLTTVPDGTRSQTSGVPKVMAEAFVRDQALALAKSETIALLRRTKRNPRAFFSELSAIARDRPLVLRDASLGEDFSIHGVTVGEGPARALERRFERGFFRITDFLMARLGACRRFEVRGQSPVVGVDAELPLPGEDPFEQDEAPCRIDRDPSRTLGVKGGNPKAPGKGPLTLRLRDVDVADVFGILHVLTAQGFLVDGDVAGRVTGDLSRVSLEEALGALAKAGLNISRPGTVRRVSLSKVSAAPGATVSNPSSTATFALKRAEVRDILAVMTEADQSLASLGPQGSYGRISLWAKDTPLPELRTAVLEAVGLKERTEEDRRILERHPGSEEPLLPVAATPPNRRLLLRPQDLAILEFELSALASSEDHWMAFAYAPTGTLNVYRAGDRLADGTVRSVESTDVLLDTDEGALRLTLPSLP